MASCGRPTCHICPAPPRCAKGNKCPRCQIAPKHEKSKHELDYKRTKGRKS